MVSTKPKIAALMGITLFGNHCRDVISRRIVQLLYLCFAVLGQCGHWHYITHGPVFKITFLLSQDHAWGLEPPQDRGPDWPHHGPKRKRAEMCENQTFAQPTGEDVTICVCVCVPRGLMFQNAPKEQSRHLAERPSSKVFLFGESIQSRKCAIKF